MQRKCRPTIEFGGVCNLMVSSWSLSIRHARPDCTLLACVVFIDSLPLYGRRSPGGFFLACMDSAFGESDALGRRVPDRPRPSTSFSLTASIGCPAPAVSTFKSEQNAYPWSLSDSSLICCSGRKPTTVACPTDFRGDTEPFMRWLEVVRVSAGRSALTDAREVRPCELYPSRQCWWGSCWRR